MGKPRQCPECASELQGRGTTCPCGWESTTRRAWKSGRAVPNFNEPHPAVQLIMDGVDRDEVLRRMRAGELNEALRAQQRRLAWARTHASQSMPPEAGSEGPDA